MMMNFSNNTKTLKEELEMQMMEFMDLAPQEVIEIIADQIKEQESTEIHNSAVKKGDMAPDFILPNATDDGKMVSLNKILQSGPVVLSFYRGEWCPYCNITLKMMQLYHDKIKSMGATLVAISPQTMESSTEFALNSNATFPVLSDEDNVVAKKFNLTFEMNKILIETIEQFGIELAKYNGKESPYVFPIPATYIINTDGSIYYSFIECNYRKRPEPTDILDVLSTIPSVKSRKKGFLNMRSIFSSLRHKIAV